MKPIPFFSYDFPSISRGNRGRGSGKFHDWEEERQCFLKQFLPPHLNHFLRLILIHTQRRRIPTHILPPPSSALHLFSNSPFVIVTEIEFEDRNVGAIFITIIRNDIAGWRYLYGICFQKASIMKVCFNSGGVRCAVLWCRQQEISTLFVPIHSISH